MKSSLLLLVILACLTLPIQQATAQKAESVLYLQTSEVNNLMVQYDADNKSITRFYTIRNSPERRTRLQKLHTDYLTELAKLNFD